MPKISTRYDVRPEGLPLRIREKTFIDQYLIRAQQAPADLVHDRRTMAQIQLRRRLQRNEAVKNDAVEGHRRSLKHPKDELRPIRNAIDPFFDRGNELTLKRRVLEYFILLQTELLIVDEVQHLNYRNGLKNDVTDTLKGLLDAGVIPIVFLGTEDAAPMFSRNLQLNGRLLSPCDLNPLNARSAIDRDLFARFVRKLEEVVVAQGVLPELSMLEAEGALPALFEVSGGVVGRVSRIFHVALEAAIRRGSHRLEVSDLSVAFDEWAVTQSFVAQNPLKGAGHG